MTDTDLRLELELMVHKLMEYCKHNQEAKDRLNEIKDFIVLYGDLKAKEAIEKDGIWHNQAMLDKQKEIAFEEGYEKGKKEKILEDRHIIFDNGNKEGAKEERTKILNILQEWFGQFRIDKNGFMGINSRLILSLKKSLGENQ